MAVSLESLDLRTLGPEAWGSRLARARREAGYGLRDVANALHPWITRAGLNALEHKRSIPERAIDRSRVLMVLVLYGVRPDDFGLGADDAPPGVDLAAVRELAPVAQGGSVTDGSQCACTRWPRFELVPRRNVVLPMRRDDPLEAA